MRRDLVDILACPHCHGRLELNVTTEKAGEVVEGTLVCQGCGRSYRIDDGLPNLLPH